MYPDKGQHLICAKHDTDLEKPSLGKNGKVDVEQWFIKLQNRTSSLMPRSSDTVKCSMLGFENSSLPPCLSIDWNSISIISQTRTWERHEKNESYQNSQGLSSYPLDILQFSYRKVWGKLNKHYSPNPLQMFLWQVYAVSIRITILHRDNNLQRG